MTVVAKGHAMRDVKLPTLSENTQETVDIGYHSGHWLLRPILILMASNTDKLR